MSTLTTHKLMICTTKTAIYCSEQYMTSTIAKNT